jgi:hypothetical protein
VALLKVSPLGREAGLIATQLGQHGCVRIDFQSATKGENEDEHIGHFVLNLNPTDRTDAPS